MRPVSRQNLDSQNLDSQNLRQLPTATCVALLADVVCNQMLREGNKFVLAIREVLTEDTGIFTCRATNPAGVAECSAELFVEGVCILRQTVVNVKFCFVFVFFSIQNNQFSQCSIRFLLQCKSVQKLNSRLEF